MDTIESRGESRIPEANDRGTIVLALAANFLRPRSDEFVNYRRRLRVMESTSSRVGTVAAPTSWHCLTRGVAFNAQIGPELIIVV